MCLFATLEVKERDGEGVVMLLITSSYRAAVVPQISDII
jgi:hypothetical protein